MGTQYDNTISLGGLLSNGLTVLAMIGGGVYMFATRNVQSDATIAELTQMKASVARLATVDSVEMLRQDMLQGFKGLAVVPDLRAEATQSDRRLTIIENRIQAHDDRLALHAQQLATEAALLDSLQHPAVRLK